MGAAVCRIAATRENADGECGVRRRRAKRHPATSIVQAAVKDLHSASCVHLLGMDEARALRGSLLCQADGCWNLVGVAEEVVDAADEVSFEAADRCAAALPVAALFGEVDRCRRVVPDLGEGEHVECVVELAVAAGVEAVAVGASG